MFVLRLKYQAIKCYYYPEGGVRRELNGKLLDKLLSMDCGKGVKICVHHQTKFVIDDNQLGVMMAYGIDFENFSRNNSPTSKSTTNSLISVTDKEIRKILDAEPPMDIKKPIAKYGNSFNVFSLDLLPETPQFRNCPQAVQECSLLHIENIGEFYLQIINQNTEKIIFELSKMQGLLKTFRQRQIKQWQVII